MKKIILTDVDDTAINTFPVSFPNWQQAARDFGFDLEEKIFRKHWGKPGLELVAHSLGIDEMIAKKIYERQIEYGKTLFIPAVPGAPESYKRLAAYYTLGAMSSRSQLRKTPPDCYPSRNGDPIQAAVQYRLDAAGIDTSDFLFILGKEDCTHHKPDRNAFAPAAWRIRRMLRDNNQHLGDVLYVGDSTFDYEGARNAGLQFVAVLTGVHTIDDFVAAGCPEGNIIPSIAELPEYLR